MHRDKGSKEESEAGQAGLPVGGHSVNSRGGRVGSQGQENSLFNLGFACHLMRSVAKVNKLGQLWLPGLTKE
jgi:hypothetical protein